MLISQLPQKLRIILWCTVVSAAIGAVYAEFDVEARPREFRMV